MSMKKLSTQCSFQSFIFILLAIFSLSTFESYAQQEQTPTEKTNVAEEAAVVETTKETSADKKPAAKEQGEQNASENSTTKPKLEIPLPQSIKKQTETDLKKALDPSLISPMLAGPNDFVTLLEKDLNANNKGVAILIPDWQQNTTNPKSINFLRKTLPKEGWLTIAIQPPLKPENYPSNNAKKALQIEENTLALKEYQTSLAAITNVVMEKAAGYPGIFLVIAEGNNAALLIDLYMKQEVPTPNALVTLSAHLLTPLDNQNLAQNMAEIELPILDMILKRDNIWVLHNAEHRRLLANKELKTYYRQQELNNINSSYYPQAALEKSIKGWLTSIGW